MKRRPDYAVYLVTDAALAGGRPVEDVVRAAVDGGVSVVQFRDKHAPFPDLLARAGRLRDFLRERGIPFIINDRADLALACGADGLHVGQEDLPCRLARRLLPADAVLGVSVSTVAEAVEAEREGADYLGVSPVFDTPTKTDTPRATGLDGLKAIRAAVSLPLVAIGGIHAGNARDVIAAGADGVAVVSAIMSAPDPRAAAQAIRAAVWSGRGLENQWAEHARQGGPVA